MSGDVVADMSTDEARERVDRVRGHVKAAWPDLIELYRRRGHLALGYASWDDLCRSEWQGAGISLPREERRQVVAQMTEAGMSTRAIASTIGVSHQTAANDQASSVKDLTVGPIQGVNGKTYQRPAPVVHITDAGEVPDSEVGEMLAAVQRVMDSDANIRRLNIAKRVLQWMNQIQSELGLMDPAEAAEAVPGKEDALMDLLERFAQWVADYKQATDEGGTVLAFIQGDQQ